MTDAASFTEPEQVVREKVHVGDYYQLINGKWMAAANDGAKKKVHIPNSQE